MASSNRFANWNRCHDRLTPEAWPEINPGFTVSPGARIVTFGSCFARNIESNLATLGFDVPTHSMRMPTEEWPSGDNQFLNRYTPAAILADIESADRHLSSPDGYDPKVSEAYLAELDDGRVIDIQFPGFAPVSRERFHARRRELLALTAQAFEAECVTITLGLVEAFEDSGNGVFACAAPTGQLQRAHPERFVFRRLTYRDCHAMVHAAITILKRRNPEVKILITTSPIALRRTFTDDDVITANTYSKSVLRAVCGDIAGEFDSVDYFPSYETAMMTKSWDIYEGDMLHLRKEFVSKIVSRLQDYYFTEVPQASVLFQKSYASFLARDFEAAAAEVEAALALAPDDPEILAHAGAVARSQGHLEAAVTHFQHAVDVAPNGERLHALSGALARAGQVKPALAAIDRALETEPGKLRHRLHKARLLMQLDQFAEAESEVDFVLHEYPSNVHGLVQKLSILKLRADDTAILATAEHALQNAANGHKDRFRAELAFAHLRLGDLDMARRYYGMATKGTKFLAGFEEEMAEAEQQSG